MLLPRGRLCYASRLVFAAWILAGAPSASMAGAGVAIVADPAAGPLRAETTMQAPGLLVALTARRDASGWGAVGAVSVSRGRWRLTAGTFRLRTLAGWTSGEASRPRDLRLWRRGATHGPSTALAGPRGLVLDGSVGSGIGSVVLLGPALDPSAEPGLLVLLGRRGPGLVWEILTGRIPAVSGAPLEAAIGAVGRAGGVVLGARREGSGHAVRVGFRRRLGRHRLDGVWEIGTGDMAGLAGVLGAPGSGWGIRYVGGAVEIRHAERPIPSGPRRRSAVAVRGRTSGASWRLELVRDAPEPGTERVRLGSHIETRGDGRWHWRLALALEPGDEGSVRSFVGVGVRGRAILGLTVSARLAAAQGGGFWTAERLGLRSVQPVYLRSGERLTSIGIRRGVWELVAYERASGGRRDMRAGFSVRLPFGTGGRR